MANLLQEFAENTSLHGPNSYVRSIRLWKLVWFLAMLAAWIVMGYQVIQVCIDFGKYKTKSVVAHEYRPDVAFPAITICNLNAIKNHSMGILGEMDPDRMRELIYHLRQISLSPIDMLSRIVSTLLFNRPSESKLAGYEVHDIIIDCYFLGTRCNLSATAKSWQHSRYGNCFTISVDTLISSTGPDQALRLMLSASIENYIGALNPTTGLRVEIHPNDIIPMPDDNGFTVAPGTNTEVSLTYTVSQRLPLPYDRTDCIGPKEFNKLQQNLTVFNSWGEEALNHVSYTTQACIRGCQQETLQRICGCVDPSQITKKATQTQWGENVRSCSLSDTADVKCVLAARNDPHYTHACGKMCPQACVEEQYNKFVSVSGFPYADFVQDAMLGDYASAAKEEGEPITEAEYKSRAEKLWFMLNEYNYKPDDAEFYNLLARGDQAAFRNVTSYFETNAVNVLIYFERLNYVSYRQLEDMPLWDFLARVGGTLGLYSGMSFLTILEFVQLVSTLICAKKKPTSTTDEKK